MKQQNETQATVRCTGRNARQRLLRAASDLLWEKSYHSVTVDEVCARADAKKGSLYYFFESKTALAVAALQHLWETVAEPAYQKYFSCAIPPLDRITSFLQWVQRLQRERHCTVGRVLGWPFFSLGCELGAAEPAISEKLCAVESAELGYFESAIRDAMDDNAIEPGDSHAQALTLRAAMEGILARARILDELDELSALSALPTILLRRNPPENGYGAGDHANDHSSRIPHSPLFLKRRRKTVTDIIQNGAKVEETHVLHTHNCRIVCGCCFSGKLHPKRRKQILNAEPAGSELPV